MGRNNDNKHQQYYDHDQHNDDNDHHGDNRGEQSLKEREFRVDEKYESELKRQRITRRWSKTRYKPRVSQLNRKMIKLKKVALRMIFIKQNQSFFQLRKPLFPGE